MSTPPTLPTLPTLPTQPTQPTQPVVGLALPAGDPAAFRLAALRLRMAADDAVVCPLAATGSLPTPGWVGVAADEAAAEGRLVAARVVALADRLARAAAVLESYGHALEGAQQAVHGLTTGAAAVVHPLAPDPALVASAYAAVLGELDIAGRSAAHRLRALAAEVGEGPPGVGGQTSAHGWSGARIDPDPHAAAWAGLPLVAGQRHRDEARDAASEVTSALESAATGDPWAVDRAATLLATWARDPVFGAALWSGRSTPESARLLADVIPADGGRGRPSRHGGRATVDPEWLGARRAALLEGLGAALVVVVNPLYSAGCDPATRDRLAVDRQVWTSRIAASVGATLRMPDGSRVGGAWLQGRLLTGAAQAGLSPGVAYATTVGLRLLEAESSPSGGPAAAGTVAGDPVLALMQALRGDVDATRAWLLHPWPTAPGRTAERLVVEHLVADRYLTVDADAARASSGALGRLVLEAGSDPGDADSMLLAGAYLDSVGQTLRRGRHPEAISRLLAPAAPDLGRLLAQHGDAVAAVLDGSADPGTDRATLTAAERLVRPGRATGTWEVVLADRPTTMALVGALALGGPGPPDGLVPSPTDPLPIALAGIGATLEADLSRAVASGPRDRAEVDIAARRLGAVTGFVLTTSAIALAGRAADLDAQHRALAGVADLAIGKLTVPGAAGKVATPLVRAAAGRAVDAVWPTGAEAAQRTASDTQLAERREQTLVAARTLVSRSRPWADDQAPARWAVGAGAARSPVPFWDATGTPLPEDVMTTAQRRSFTDWRRDEALTVYDTVPQAIRDGIDAGIRDGADGAARP